MTMQTTKGTARNKRGSLTEFGAALSVFFCCVFVPLVDISFVPARYLLTYTNMDRVVHRMALTEKRSLALKYLHGDPTWKKIVEGWGVTVKDVKASLVVCEQGGSTKLTLAENSRVPNAFLPNGSKLPNGGSSYALEITTTVDIPPLYSSKVGLPGFTQPIEFKFRNRAQWENLSPDPYTTTDPKAPQYYINE